MIDTEQKNEADNATRGFLSLATDPEIGIGMLIARPFSFNLRENKTENFRTMASLLKSRKVE